MVLRHGSVVAEGWAAPFAPDRLHELFSLSKSFTSTAVGFAVAEGLLDVDDLVLDLFGDEAPADAGREPAADAGAGPADDDDGARRRPHRAGLPDGATGSGRSSRSPWSTSRARTSSTTRRAPTCSRRSCRRLTGQRLLDYLARGCSSRSASRARPGSSRRRASTSAATGCRRPPRTSRCSASCTCRTVSGTGARCCPRAGPRRRRARRCPTATTRTTTGRRGTATSSGAGGTTATAATARSGSTASCCPSRTWSSRRRRASGHARVAAGLGAPAAGPGRRPAARTTTRAAGCSATARRDAPRPADRRAELPAGDADQRPHDHVRGEPARVAQRGARGRRRRDRLTVDLEEETVFVAVGHAQPALTRTRAAAPRTRRTSWSAARGRPPTPTC